MHQHSVENQKSNTVKQTFWDFCAGTATAMNSYTVNDLFSAQCAKQSLFLFQYLLGKNVPFNAPIMKHFPG